MDLSYSADHEAFRQQVRSFVAAEWPRRGAQAQLPMREQVRLFRERAIDAGYYARAVPRRYGGSEQPADPLQAAIIREEVSRARAPRELGGVGPSMLVPTLLERGEEWQRERFIRPAITGEVIWCQGYSEPGAGSDLASVRTRARLVADEWVIDGQKIWTSDAHRARYMFALVRTEPEAPKHAGLSYLLIDMAQPGIEARPLDQMHGETSFNQVFFRGARTPASWIVGRRGEGWSVSRSTLVHERNWAGEAQQLASLFANLVALARSRQRGGQPALRDPALRQRLAALEGYVRSAQYSGYRQLSCALHGGDPGPLPFMNKLVATQIQHELGRIALDLLGDDGLLAPAPGVRGEPPPGNQRWVFSYMASLGLAIGGGTSNIQRNVIAERGLGLPRDSAASTRS